MMRRICIARGYSPELVHLSLRDSDTRTGNLLDMLAPNGKRVGDCTGEELKRDGKFLAALAEAKRPFERESA
jgi:hypothetical protein